MCSNAHAHIHSLGLLGLQALLNRSKLQQHGNPATVSVSVLVTDLHALAVVCSAAATLLCAVCGCCAL